jgi:hypothetical protein
MMLCAAALILATPMTIVAEDKAVPAQEAKLAKPAELKIWKGEKEGQKTPLETMMTAIKHAKAGKAAELKALWTAEKHEWLDQQYWGNDGKEQTVIQAISGHLATLSDKAEDWAEMAQNRVGKFAAVRTKGAKGMHVIPLSVAGKGWFLRSTAPDDYTRDMESGMKELIEAIKAGTGSKIKEFVGESERAQLDLLAGVKDGADPYDLLAKRLKDIAGERKPTVLQNANWPSQLAFWFNDDKFDGFIITQLEYDWQTEKYRTVISLDATARFHKNAAEQMQWFVMDDDQEWYYPKSEEGPGK